MAQKVVCVDCGSDKIYRFEFRTDYAKPRDFYPVNPGVENTEPPYRFEGYYCDNCEEAVSVKTINN